MYCFTVFYHYWAYGLSGFIVSKWDIGGKMDNADRAQKLRVLYLKHALENQKNQKEILKNKGKCLNCDEPLERKIFCDIDCRNDYEKRQRCQNMR